MSQPQTKIISSFELINGNIINPLLLFHLELGLECTKKYRFVEYTHVKCFNIFVQSAVKARRKGDENPKSSVVTETLKLLENSSNGYQLIDSRRFSITKCTSDEETHTEINNNLFKRLGYFNDHFFEVELAKSESEHKKPIIVVFFNLQHAKMRMLELLYNFFSNVCDTDKYQELELDTDSLYSALSENELSDCIQSEKSQEWELLRSNDCNDSFTAEACSNFLIGRFVLNTEAIIKKSLNCSRKTFDAHKGFVCVARPTAVTTP